MATAPSQSDIADAALADDGVRRIEWADQSMPVLDSIRRRFERERPLDGLRIGACLHVTAETANLVRTLQAGGAEPSLCASNPLSTQDDVAAALVHVYGASTYAINGEDSEIYYDHIESVLNNRPHLTTDDGADLVSTHPHQTHGRHRRRHGRHRGDHHRRDPTAGHGHRGRASDTPSSPSTRP